MKNAFVACFVFVVHVFICHPLRFAALRCSFLFFFYLRNQNKQMPLVARLAFYCSFWLFVDVSIGTSHCSFWLFVGMKNQNEQQKEKCPNGNQA